MRENIGLYRGKRLDNGEWVEGWLVIKKDPVLEITYCFILAYGEGESFVTWYPVDPETVGECIGIPSKNGKLIFEGDILKDEWGKIYKVIFSTKSCSFMAECTVAPNEYETGRYRIGDAWCDTIAAIGNIHDNPELLTQKNIWKERNGRIWE